MYNRQLFAITLASAFIGAAVPAEAQWSPLARDVKQEIGSSEKAPELSDFHKLRDQLTAEEQAELQAQKNAKKKNGLLGRFKKSSPTAAQPLPPGMRPEPEAPKASVADGDEPGTAPAKELLEAEGKDKTEGEEEDAPKKAKALPGAQPKEETEDAGYFIRRAVSYSNQKDFQSALNYIDKALELQPQNWDAWYTKAMIYQLAGYDAAAAKRYLKLLEHKPDMVQAHIGMGMLYRKHGNLDLAQKEYEDAINLVYYSFPAHFNLANLLMEQKKGEAALKEYKVCMKLQPNNALVHNNMGVIFQSKNYLEEAAQEFKKASNLEPANKMFTDNLNHVRSLSSKKPGQPTL